MKKERTLVVIKPDGIQRSLIGEIIGRFERVGLKLVATKMFVATPEFIKSHYTLDPEWMRKTGEKTIAGYLKKGMKPPYEDPIESSTVVLGHLQNYISSGPVIAMVWQGAHVVPIVRKLVGGTEPLTSDVGTIRGDYVLDSYQLSDTAGRSIRNLIHASGTPEEAKMEINLWFKESEIIEYKLAQEAIMYDVNLDGIME